MNISGSPYRRWFTAGRVEARRSRVARAGAALVWCAGHARALHLHPRDQYDNPTPAPQPEVYTCIWHEQSRARHASLWNTI